MTNLQEKLDGRCWTEEPLPEILRDLNRRGATGILTVGTPSIDREFIFVSGELRAARSSIESEKLGSWLVVHSLISPGRKKELLQIQEGSDAPPLGHILVTERILRRHTLERALEGLALAILERATNEELAEFLFTEGRDAGQLDTLPGITTQQLILLSARYFNDFERKKKLLSMEEHHLSLELPLEEIIQDFELATDEATLLGKLYLSRSVGDLRKSLKMDRERFVSACYPLVISGLISVVPRPKMVLRSKVVKGESVKKQFSAEVGTDEASASEQEVWALRRLHARMKDLDHYEFFGVSAYASYQDIADRWEEFDRLYNPVRVSEPGMAAFAAELKEVHARAEEGYKTLSNPRLRPRYDRMLRARAAGPEEQEPIPDNETAREALVRENLREVESLIRREDFFSAIQLMEKTTDLDPSPTNLLKLAHLLLLNPKWTARALEKLKRALEADSKLVEGWLLLAEHWRNRKSPERERKALERALMADAGNVRAHSEYESLVGTDAMQRFLRRLGAVKTESGSDGSHSGVHSAR